MMNIVINNKKSLKESTELELIQKSQEILPETYKYHCEHCQLLPINTAMSFKTLFNIVLPFRRQNVKVQPSKNNSGEREKNTLIWRNS